MFGLFKSRKATQPALSPGMEAVINTTISVSRLQMEQFFQRRLAQVPFMTPDHDLYIGCYLLGFVTGGYQMTKAHLIWAKGDEAMADLGWYISVATVHTALYGERCLDIADGLPQMNGMPATGNFETLDRAGGADGMATADTSGARTIRNNLLTYLSHNITAEEKSAVQAL